MSEAIQIALQVLSLGFVVSMFVALLIKLTYMAINASTTSSQPVVKAEKAANQEETANQEEAANQEETMVFAEPAVEKPINTRSVSPEIVAVITGAVAALLDDQDMERFTVSSIQAL